jgi:hypothetical protein
MRAWRSHAGDLRVKGNKLVDWEEDVRRHFEPARELTTPWRWKNAREEGFGRWLLDIRQKLLTDEAINLASMPKNVQHVALDGDNDYQKRLRACGTKAPTTEGCVLIIADATNPPEQRRFASQTPGAVVAENVDLRDFVEFARNFDLGAPKVLVP